ncbi:hypothetical protein BC937DRAFT_87181 [Endogone sp. FLAS-F59071]|nr:hypothetical protein BC937DRAFT_87181 [Endogone sp. FLAS-F59071]|eukprot:RUS19631.1 hypothetical protein BC937DRAFT_87181 [Endogone sp. FLAS-F59071]
MEFERHYEVVFDVLARYRYCDQELESTNLLNPYYQSPPLSIIIASSLSPLLAKNTLDPVPSHARSLPSPEQSLAPRPPSVASQLPRVPTGPASAPARRLAIPRLHVRTPPPGHWPLTRGICTAAPQIHRRPRGSRVPIAPSSLPELTLLVGGHLCRDAGGRRGMGRVSPQSWGEWVEGDRRDRWLGM